MDRNNRRVLAVMLELLSILKPLMILSEVIRMCVFYSLGNITPLNAPSLY